MSRHERFGRWAQLVALALFAGWFLIAGIAHIVRRSYFHAVMAPIVPAPELVNAAVAAGLIATGIGLIIPRTRTHAAVAVVGALVLFEFAHIEQLVNNVRMIETAPGNWTRTTGNGDTQALLFRVVLQVPLTLLAFWLVARLRNPNGHLQGAIRPSQ